MRRTSLAGALLALFIVLAPTAASADSVSGEGYACRVSYVPPVSPGGIILLGPTPGNFGYLTFAIYSGEHCTGTLVRTVTAYSTGSTVATYTGNSLVYGEAALLALWQSVQRAADSGEPIFFTGSTWLQGVFSGTQLLMLRFSDY